MGIQSLLRLSLAATPSHDVQFQKKLNGNVQNTKGLSFHLVVHKPVGDVTLTLSFFYPQPLFIQSLKFMEQKNNNFFPIIFSCTTVQYITRAQ